MKAPTAVFATIVAGLACSTAAAQPLSLIDLGAGTQAFGINASGQITGCAPAGAGATHAFLYSAGVMTDLGTLGGTGSCGYGINVSGQVTGYADTGTASHAFLYSNGAMTDLGSLGGLATSAGVSINARGDIAGYAWAWPKAPFAPLQPPGVYNAAQLVTQDSGYTALAFLYTNGAMTNIFPAQGGTASQFALAINDGGEVGGATGFGCGILCPTGNAITWVGGVATALKDLIVNHNPVFLTVITGINDAGQIVAYGEDPDAYMHGVIYTNGIPLDLGNNTEAFALNSSGDVVGFKLGDAVIGLYGNIGKDMTPFIYSQGAKRDLDLPGAIPTGINDSGLIILNHLTLNHAYVLAPSSISLAPFGVSFGTISFGQTNPPPVYDCGACTVTLTNHTAASIPVTGIAIAGAFAQTNTCTGSLSTGASCVITLTFKPTVPDIELGALTVSAAGTQYATLLRGATIITSTISSTATAATVNVPFTLTWKASPGSRCMASGDTQFSGSVAVNGSKAITEPVAQTITFTLACTQGSQSSQAQVTVKVAAASSGGGSSSGGGGGGGILDLASVVALLTLWGLHRSGYIKSGSRMGQLQATPLSPWRHSSLRKLGARIEEPVHPRTFARCPAPAQIKCQSRHPSAQP